MDDPDVSILTMVKGRPGHLRNLLEGLARNTVLPTCCILVDLNDIPVLLPELPFPIRHHHAPTNGLPLGAARNQAADLARTAGLIFLDVDCIPAPDLVERMSASLRKSDALVCCEVLYLPAGAKPASMSVEQCLAEGKPHPHRPFPTSGHRRENNAGLFWSLAFAVRRSTFMALGGFDATFTGYGAEDTDLSFRAKACGVPLILTAETRAFHQYHAVFDPPLQHFSDILDNAARFHAKHGIWPMEGWLRDFAAQGLIEWIPGTSPRLLRHPTTDEVSAAACGRERAF